MAGYGTSAGLPPGSLPLVSRGYRPRDRWFIANRIARYGPISKAVVPGMAQPVVCISGLERGRALLRAHRDRLEWLGHTFDELIPARFIRSMSAADHRHYRRVLGVAFTDRPLEASSTLFAASARSALHELAAVGGPVDPRPALARFTLTAFARLFFGVLPETEQHATIASLYLEPGVLSQGRLDRGQDPERQRAVATMTQLVRRQADRASPSADQPTISFLSEIVTGHEGAEDDPNVVLNLIFLLATASQDVTGLMHWIVKLLAENDGWVERIRGEDVDGRLARDVVAETLRLAQSEYLARRVVAPFEFGGCVVPKGWYVRVCVQEAHRDPAVFDNPDRFDPDRFADQQYSRDEYAPLGMLNHSCLGADATFRLCETFVRELSFGYEVRVASDGEPIHDGHHWRPSPSHRVELAPVRATAYSEPVAGQL
jgi:cytochrome P450